MSQHFEEKTIELIALGSEKVAGIRKEFFEHIRTCRACGALYEEMREFHAALAGPAALPEGGDGARHGLQVSPSFGAAMQHMRQDRGLVSRIWHHHRRSVVSVGSFFVVGAAALLLSLRAPAGGGNPHHAVFDPSIQAVRITDVTGADMFSIPLPAYADASSMQMNGVSRTVVLDDLDGDRTNEVVTTLPVNLRGLWQPNVVRVFSADGSLRWQRVVGDTILFDGELFLPQFQARGLAAIRTEHANAKDLLVGAAHTHSPFILYRFDAHGSEIGQYRNFGHLQMMQVMDLEQDGSQEVLITGTQHQDEIERRAIVVALDPMKIVGETEASFTTPPGLGMETSEAERKVFRLPHSFVDTLAPFPLTVAAGIRVLNSERIAIDVWSSLDGKVAIWEYLFDRTLVPLQVKWSDSVREVHTTLRREGRLNFELSHQITDRMFEAIEVWDGQQWVLLGDLRGGSDPTSGPSGPHSSVQGDAEVSH